MRKFYFFSTLMALIFAATTLSAGVAVDGKLPCQFSVSSTKTVYFSQGNLQYNSNTQKWQFASEQYSYVGNAAGNTSVTQDGITSGNGIVDLFGWVGASSIWTGLKQYGLTSSTATNNTDGYGNDATEDLKSDWGSLMGTDWFTLSSTEWTYLINSRPNAILGQVNSTYVRYAGATLTIDAVEIHGIIIFPDGYAGGTPAGVTWGTLNNTNIWGTACTKAGWEALEAAGCVFLPAAGNRYGTSVNDAGSFGGYWSSSSRTESVFRANYLYFISNYLNTAYSSNNRSYGHSVRLVQDATGDAPTASVTTAPEGQTISFDNTSHELVSAGIAQNGTMMYSLDNVTFSTAIPTASAIGTYTVYYYAEGAGCFASSAVSSVTAKIEAAVYDNADPTATLTTLNNSGNPEPTNLTVYRTIYRNGEYNTICLPFALDASALAASPLAGFNNLKTIKGASVTGSGQALSIDIFVEDVTEMEAGKPYLISYPSANENIVNPVFTGITVSTTEPGNVEADGVTFQGMFAQVHIDPYTEETRAYDYLFLGANSQLMWPLSTETSESVKMRGFRAYFIIDRNAIPAQVAPRGTHARFVNAPKQPTSIENTELNTQAQKLLENGQLIILKNGIKYNAQGQVLK